MLFKNKKILVLAPHTDDAEFGCGASIANFIESKNEVFCATFSACEQSVLPQFPSDILITEVKKASEVMGLKKENLILFDFQVRTFNYKRQEILEEIIKLKNDIKPDIVLLPSVNDIHQDHATIANEGIRAFKFSTILSYEMPWNNFNFNSCCFISLSEKNLQTKIDAVKCYASQAHRPYANENFIRSLATVRGTQIGKTYAETFEVLRVLL
jgi:LmbE family N-acetylglucosaminyl deacetylase